MSEMELKNKLNQLTKDSTQLRDEIQEIKNEKKGNFQIGDINNRVVEIEEGIICTRTIFA